MITETLSESFSFSLQGPFLVSLSFILKTNDLQIITGKTGVVL